MMAGPLCWIGSGQVPGGLLITINAGWTATSPLPTTMPLARRGQVGGSWTGSYGTSMGIRAASTALRVIVHKDFHVVVVQKSWVRELWPNSPWLEQSKNGCP